VGTLRQTRVNSTDRDIVEGEEISAIWLHEVATVKKVIVEEHKCHFLVVETR
jgi:hypothetical protein